MILSVLKRLRVRRNVKVGTKRRTIVFNVDVARRRKPISASSEKGRGRGAARRAAGAVGFLALCLLSVALVERGTVQPSGFIVRWMEVSNNDLLSKREIISLSGVKVGDNLLSTDIAKVRAKICGHPDVKDVIVTRKMPGTLVIRVYERFPIAAFHSPSVGSGRGAQNLASSPSEVSVRRCVLDEEGYILSSRKEMSNQSLPYIVGMRMGAVRHGDRLGDPAVRKGLEIVKRYRESELCRRLELVSVDVSDPENYVMRSVQIQEIRLGNENLSDRLQLLSHILAQRSARGINGFASYLDLRWKDAAEMPLAGNVISMK
ncbi:MAG: FtsQ-type POTRA domain-containing protein [Candidatus Aureabacteria bacterium]|nr:FtsQ-type POTRA domain-containing protein [Candidatus Auribacterota bacterium]